MYQDSVSWYDLPPYNNPLSSNQRQKAYRQEWNDTNSTTTWAVTTT